MTRGIDPAWAEDTSQDVSFNIAIHTMNSIMEPKARLVLAKAVLEAATKLRAQGLLLGYVGVVLTRSSKQSALTFDVIDLPDEVTPDE